MKWVFANLYKGDACKRRDSLVIKQKKSLLVNNLSFYVNKRFYDRVAKIRSRKLG